MLKTRTSRSLLAVLPLMATLSWAASPSLGIILPRGVQRGSEQELVFAGGHLADAQAIFFYDKGFEVTALEPSEGAVKVKVKIAPDCRLGEHVAQVRTASGISEYRSFYVGPFPAVAEVEPNSQFDTPQPIQLNVTVQGVVDSEDVDYYIVEAKKGQRISLDVYAMRLGSALFDPYVAILDEKRFELDSSDDSPLCLQDAMASIVAPEDGKYVIEMRESAYGGDGNSRYLLSVSTAPSASAVYPSGGKIGEVTDVTFLGDPAGPIAAKITAPAEPATNFSVHAEDAAGIEPTGSPFRLFKYGNVLEQEPNEDFQTATPAELPLAFNGIIQKEGDVDNFKFSAKQGQVFEVECYARRVRSPLDPVMSVFYADHRGIVGADDSRGPDSYFRFQAPEDGQYVLQIYDHLKRGGEDFVYRVEFQSIEPSLSLSIPRVALYSQYRQTIYVPRGGRFGTLINASRNNFGGDLVLDGQGLPPGIKMVCDPMPAGWSQMPVVFEAAADAPLGGALVDFTAHNADTSTGISGRFSNLADMIIGPPGQSLYWHTDVDRLAVAVVDELPFQLEIVQPKAPLVRDGSMQLKIVVHRKEGFTQPVNVEFPFRPPGVGAASSITIPGDQTEGYYPLNADGGAQEGNWPVYAIGNAEVNGTAWNASQLARLQIAVQPVTLAMDRASCEQGQEAQIYCKLTQNAPFEGNAKIRLIGLPPKVETSDLEFNKEAQELVFKLKTTAESPVGQHKNLFCEVVILQEGEPITLRAGLTELQIDAPLPAAQSQPQPMAQPADVAAAPAQPAEKPLSRLEKLRLEAQKRAEKEKNGTSGGNTSGGS
jgi:hypothetical protein